MDIESAIKLLEKELINYDMWDDRYKALTVALDTMERFVKREMKERYEG